MLSNKPQKRLAPILALLGALSIPAFATDTLDETRKEALRHLLLHDCGSCHGMTLKGGLGPPLTVAALSNKPEPYVYYTIRNGHPGTPMPPWRDILTDSEIRYLVQLLLSGEVGA